MLTDRDIKKLAKYFSTVFPTKDDFEDLRKDFSDLQSSVDAYAKKADTFF